jgi:AraC-like DNA-binding protein
MSNSFQFINNDRGNLLGQLSEQFSVSISDNRVVLPPHIGSGYLSEYALEQGLSVAFGEMELRDQVEFIDNSNSNKNSITIFFKFIERGSIFFRPFDGKYKEVKSGGVHFYSSDTFNKLVFPANSHSFLFRVHVSMKWLSCNLSDFFAQNEAFFSMIFGKNKIRHFEPLTNRFVRLFRDVFKSEFDLKLSHLIVKDKGYEALVIFFDHFYKQFYKQNLSPSKYSIEDQKRLYALTEFINANLDLNLSLDQLAREVGFSKSKLQSLFHYFFNTSIYAYIKSLRFEKAVKLLLCTDKDIKFIADHLGYKSSTHFINIFRDHYGVSPKKYRQKNLILQKTE